MIDNLTEAFSEIILTGKKNNKHEIEQNTRPQLFDSNFANIQLMEHSLLFSYWTASSFRRWSMVWKGINALDGYPVAE